MSAAILRYEAGARHEASRPHRRSRPRPAATRRRRGRRSSSAAARHGTSLADLYQRTPCRVLFPRPEPDELPVAVLLTTSGGLTGGDQLRVSIDGRPRAPQPSSRRRRRRRSIARSMPTRPSRSRSPVGERRLARIPAAGDDPLRRRAARPPHRGATLAPDARLLACEMVVFGRLARDERCTQGCCTMPGGSGATAGWSGPMRCGSTATSPRCSPRQPASAARGRWRRRSMSAAMPRRLMPLARDARRERREPRRREPRQRRADRALPRPRPELVRRDLMRYVTGLRQGAGRAATLPRVWHS